MGLNQSVHDTVLTNWDTRWNFLLFEMLVVSSPELQFSE